MSNIRGFLIDLDGVIYTGNKPVKGADAALRLIEETGYQYRIVSNSTRSSRRSIAGKLQQMGLDIPESKIFTPAIAATEFLKASGSPCFRLLVTGTVTEDFLQVKESENRGQVDFLILGDAGNVFTYDSLNRAFRELMEGAELIALENDRYWMASDGLSLAAGPFVTALEFATGKKATLMGKPSKTFFELALKDIGIGADQSVMIGDDIYSDIGGAQRAGIRGVLVRTGKYRDENFGGTQIRPDMTIDSIAEIRILLEMINNNR